MAWMVWVNILQKLLQQYAAIQISRARAMQQKPSNTPASKVLENLLVADPETWEMEIQKGFEKRCQQLGSRC
jgi:hypothetical protein